MLENNDGIEYKRKALTIIGQIAQDHPRITRDQAIALANGNVRDAELLRICDAIAGAPDSERAGPYCPLLPWL